VSLQRTVHYRTKPDANGVMRAMILAAGRGARMRPLTDHTPKPLLQAGGKALIVRQIERLRAAGIRQLVINVAWRGERIERALGDGTDLGVAIQYSREPEDALETAGGIRTALPLLGNDPFVVVSSDIHCDFPIAQLVDREPAGEAHLVLVDNPPHHPEGDFALAGGRVVARGAPRLTYSGIGLFRAEMFAELAPGRRALRPVLDESIAAGRVTGEHHVGTWLDIGTPERLAELERLLASHASH
jgi:MurNAc alpha-1-phosphate uridylyltransferase